MKQSARESRRIELATINGSLPAVPATYAFHFAVEYHDRGWPVIPLNGKRPALPSWKEFQQSRPTLGDLRRWFTDERHNIGIVTGRRSGLVVVDCDTPDEVQFWRSSFPDTPLVVQTGGGGAHFYYRYPAAEAIGNRVHILSRRIDVRADGGYVVAPPSVHSSGKLYQWQCFGDYSLEEVPYFSKAWIASPIPRPRLSTGNWRIRDPRAYIATIHAVSGHGGHNQTFRVACLLRDAGLSPEEALSELTTWNETNANPPWSQRELLHKVESAFGTPNQ